MGALNYTIHIKRKFGKTVFIYLLIYKSHLKNVTKCKVLNYETTYAQELFAVVIVKHQKHLKCSIVNCWNKPMKHYVERKQMRKTM